MIRGGRPKDLIWRHFTKIEVNGKVWAKCNYCDHQQSTMPCRMKSHHSFCKGAQPVPEIDVVPEVTPVPLSAPSHEES